MVEQGFTKAQSDNLPYIDEFMVTDYIKNNDCYTSAEIRGVKARSSSREQYGDNAIGYVQVKREGNECIIKGKITPEHNVRNKQYNLYMHVDEENCKVMRVKCEDCPASEGGCKHSIAFLMWVHRRSRDPAPTEIQCYWKKSALSRVGTSLKFITAAKFNKPLPKSTNEALILSDTPGTSSSEPHADSPTSVYEKFLNEAKKRKIDSQILKHVHDIDHFISNLSLHHLMCNYTGIDDAENFITFIKNEICDELLLQAEKKTRNQSKSTLWFELRYGRITASKAYEISRCKKVDGTLVEKIMGAGKVPDTVAMKRGRELEESVRRVVEEQVSIKFQKCGIFISDVYPFIGASPDGISKDFCLEIKCPSSEKNVNNYVKENKVVAKFYAQVQIQMFITNKKKCLFCVADPKFEENKKVNIVEVEIDNDYLDDLFPLLVEFWKSCIYKKIYNIVHID